MRGPLIFNKGFLRMAIVFGNSPPQAAGNLRLCTSNLRPKGRGMRIAARVQEKGGDGKSKNFNRGLPRGWPFILDWDKRF